MSVKTGVCVAGEGASTVQAGVHPGRAKVHRGGRGGPVPPCRHMGTPIAEPPHIHQSGTGQVTLHDGVW